LQNHTALALQAALSSGFAALEVLPVAQPERLLLDIQLKDKSAFELLEQIEVKLQSRIIFITAYDQYAVTAFEISAIDYLLKPFSDERFDQAIQKMSLSDQPDWSNLLPQLLAKLNKPSSSSRIMIPEGNKKHFFQTEQIQYFRADLYYVKVIAKTNTSLIRITMKNLSQLLPAPFIRVNKSVIINFHYVDYLDQQKNKSRIFMKDGVEFWVTPAYREQFNTFLRSWTD
jgi:two-component system LytT family response regulator